jgi:uncharacterized protein (TIGR02413 family)
MSCGVFLWKSVKGGDSMTIHLLFVTLTIKRKQKSIDQVLHEEQVYQSYEAMMNKCFQMYNGN